MSRERRDPAELHVAGLIVRCRVEDAAAVARRIAVLPGAFVHAEDGGKLIVTLEGDGARHLSAGMDAIAVLPGVAVATLVYHHADPLEEDPR